jgi:GTP cyclohydrolase IA
LTKELSIVRTFDPEIETEDRLAQHGEPLAPGQVGKLTKIYHDLLDAIGEDSTRQGLVKTPARAARAMEFLTQGYRQSVEEIINDAIFDSDASEIILVKDIELYSMCEHHLLPFIGRAHVAYIPNGKAIGLSKVARIVDVFARRLQIQENLTTQIAESLMNCLEPNGVAVVVEAKHLCMMMRGVEKQNSVMITSSVLGTFRESTATREEFLALIGNRPT